MINLRDYNGRAPRLFFLSNLRRLKFFIEFIVVVTIYELHLVLFVSCRVGGMAFTRPLWVTVMMGEWPERESGKR